ncbi:MAG: hypothetical protein CO126_03360 [Hydrogenophilales bacterium CG_4_9_14_3_um_filter_63_34]|nr:MAG: hypothetical protein COZ24_15265 [Hydrogenophilales bacterium CG_4_10_14_3_um_filter_63_21]PJB05410.1 MAG: hypothetical protein CO126_03360 [Hydrogenophilales bacterium CG_4_9_14_3_um_filter_63_34]
MELPLLLALALFTLPALASHQWGGVDICEVRRDIMPPRLDPALLPEPASPGARALQRYCTQCHYLTGPGRHTQAEWPDVLRRMETLMSVSHFYRGLLGQVAIPNADEQAALSSYLDRNALRPLPPRPTGPPALGAERAYRAVCGDCHAAPDPRAYPVATWPDLLARMDRHRKTMARPPLSAALRSAVGEFIGVAWGAQPVAGVSHQSVSLPLPATAPIAADPWGRLVSLAVFFGLAALGLWRWQQKRD